MAYAYYLDCPEPGMTTEVDYDCDYYSAKNQRKVAHTKECLMGVVGEGFVIVAADGSTGYRFVGPRTTKDKVDILSSHMLLAAAAWRSDRSQFVRHIHTNLPHPNTVASTANFIREQLARVIHSGLKVDMLLGGYEEGTGPSLYYIDCNATLQKVEKAAIGVFGSSFQLSAMDSLYNEGMSLEEGIRLIDACIDEARSTLNVDSQHYVIKVVDKHGAREYAWRKAE